MDFTPAMRATAAVVGGIDQAQLSAPTPCSGLVVADLIHHLGGLADAFTLAATKSQSQSGDGDAEFDGARLSPRWRSEIPTALDRLGTAWADPAAYDGITTAGPFELPAEVVALIALDEVVVHGWDLARATGQPYAPPQEALEACLGFAAGFETPEGAGDGPFGPAVPVPDSAPTLHRLLGATGRDPDWAPAT